MYQDHQTKKSDCVGMMKPSSNGGRVPRQSQSTTTAATSGSSNTNNTTQQFGRRTIRSQRFQSKRVTPSSSSTTTASSSTATTTSSVSIGTQTADDKKVQATTSINSVSVEMAAPAVAAAVAAAAPVVATVVDLLNDSNASINSIATTSILSPTGNSGSSNGPLSPQQSYSSVISPPMTPISAASSLSSLSMANGSPPTHVVYGGGMFPLGINLHSGSFSMVPVLSPTSYIPYSSRMSPATTSRHLRLAAGNTGDDANIRMSPNWHLITSVKQCRKACGTLRGIRASGGILAVDCEGVLLGRTGRLCLIQIASARAGRAITALPR
jgi:hypothetical protein